jgi:hypothetical protein
MKKIISSLLFVMLAITAIAQQTIQLNNNGIKLRQFYLSQNVENLWLPGHHINWETGEPDNPNATKNIKTHCSVFVASVCKQKNIYILRPPDHSQSMLANAQFDWLFSADTNNKGWHQIKDSIYEKAQELANKGFVVIAVYKNPNRKKSGHIALVMPMEKSGDDLTMEGPSLIQAGRINCNNISLKKAFKKHISNWTMASNEILFFYFANSQNTY